MCAFGALIREPLLSRTDSSTSPVAAAALARRGADRARDHRRRRRTGVSIMRLTGASTAARCARRAEPIGPDDYGSLAGASGARRRAAGGGARRGSPTPPRFGAARGGRHLRREDRRRGPRARPGAHRGRARAPGARADPHIGARAALADGTSWASRARRWRRRAGERGGRRRLGSCGGEVGVDGSQLLYGASDGALELLEVQPPGGRPMGAEAYLRGHALSERARPAPTQPASRGGGGAGGGSFSRQSPRLRVRGAAQGVRAVAPTQIARFARRRASSRRVTGRWRCGWRTGRCSGKGHAGPSDRTARRAAVAALGPRGGTPPCGGAVRAAVSRGRP